MRPPSLHPVVPYKDLVFVVPDKRISADMGFVNVNMERGPRKPARSDDDGRADEAKCIQVVSVAPP